MVSMETHVNLVVWIVGGVLLVITLVTYFSVVKAESKSGELKGVHLIFPIFLVFTSLYWSQLPGIQGALPSMMSAFRSMIAGVAAPKDATTTVITAGLPAGSPADYVEWADGTHLQPKAGAPVLPTGWRVAVTNDPAKPGIVVDKIVEKAETDVWVFFDPDTTVLPGKASLAPIKLTITRP